ncbi:MAG: S-adenosylmethionine decarboxylase [Deltaproteobacteria bacterium]|nr:S-adenosylmethionine decarboxylase [Deltaproteobacteria bacterium]
MIQHALARSATESGTRIAPSYVHAYSPQGCSLAAQLTQTGWLVLHTWPEFGLATIDVVYTRARAERGETTDTSSWDEPVSFAVSSVGKTVQWLLRELGWTVVESSVDRLVSAST